MTQHLRTTSRTAWFLLLVALLGTAVVQADDKCSVGTVLGNHITESSTALEDGTLQLVANRPNDYILEPNRRDLLRKGGSYPFDLLVPEKDKNEAFRGALLRIQGEGTLEAGSNAQLVDCDDENTHAIMTTDETRKTEFGGIFTVATNATNPDIRVAISALFWSIEDGSRLAEGNFVFGLAPPRTSSRDGTVAGGSTASSSSSADDSGDETTSSTASSSSSGDSGDDTTSSRDSTPTTASSTSSGNSGDDTSTSQESTPTTTSSSTSGNSGDDTTTSRDSPPMTTTTTTAKAPTVAPVSVPAPTIGAFLLDPPTVPAAPSSSSDRETEISSTVVGTGATSGSTPVEVLPTAMPTMAPTTTGDRYFLESGEPACQFCDATKNMTLGMSKTTPLLVIIHRLPFYCHDFMDRPELFPESFCNTHRTTIMEQCGGCVESSANLGQGSTTTDRTDGTTTTTHDQTDGTTATTNDQTHDTTATSNERDTPNLTDPLVNSTKDPVFGGEPGVSPVNSTTVAAATLDTPAAAPTDAITYILSGTITLYYADEGSKVPACNLCGGPQYTLGDTSGTIKVDKLPFNCRDLAQVPEMFYPEFCDINADLIVRVCGGCVLIEDDASATSSTQRATTAVVALVALLVGLIL